MMRRLDFLPTFVTTSRYTNERSLADFTPPWHAVQFWFRIGRISELKSIRCACAAAWPAGFFAACSAVALFRCGASSLRQPPSKMSSADSERGRIQGNSDMGERANFSTRSHDVSFVFRDKL